VADSSNKGVSSDDGATRLPASFEPLRRATRARLAVLYIAGPFLWVASLLVVGYVIRHGREVGIALVVLAAAFLVALAFLIPMRMRRVREEAERP
jgi:hypothetical protein